MLARRLPLRFNLGKTLPKVVDVEYNSKPYNHSWVNMITHSYCYSITIRGMEAIEHQQLIIYVLK